MIREQNILRPFFPLPQGLPLVLMQPQRRLDPASRRKGRAWAMPGLVAQSRGAVPSGSAYLYR